MGADLENLLDDRSRTQPFRVVVSLSQGSVNNLDDLLNLEKIDVGIVQGDVLEAFAENPPLYAELSRKMRYIAPLHREEIHLLARRGIADMHALTIARVGIGAPGSGTQITARNLFRKLGVTPKLLDESATPQAIDKLLRGQLDVVVYVVGKGAAAFASIGAEQAEAASLHFLPLPADLPGLEQYVTSQLTGKDYPNIIPLGQAVPVRAVQSLMVVYAWAPGDHSGRYASVERFVTRFFDRAPQLAKGGFSPSWCQVDLAASAGGPWERFEPAERWLRQNTQPTRLCEVAGSVCPCPQSNADVSSACMTEFLDYYRQQGMPIANADRPEPRRLLAEWRKTHPDCH
jgi:hypothetical protein